MIKRCKSTFLRQATRLPNLSKNDILRYDPANINRFNRSYEVFKNMRGTAMFYQNAKKNLMALVRQLGCPTIFLTLSCAEFDWHELLKEIVETVERRRVSDEYINNLSTTDRNKLISRNVVQTTLHFQKRINKFFSIIKRNFFKDENESYTVENFYYRVEFQQRGSPHIHSVLWLKTLDGRDAPGFWINAEDLHKSNSTRSEDRESIDRIKTIENFANNLITSSPLEVHCKTHDNSEERGENCEDCQDIQEKAKRFQLHSHTFTCAKKGKTLTIDEGEGHGRLDGIKKGAKLMNIIICRFNFPKYPMPRTLLIPAMSKDMDEDMAKHCKSDLKKNYKVFDKTDIYR